MVRGLRRHGPGKWALILSDYDFNANRTSVDLKDKFRNMLRRGEIPQDIIRDYNLELK